MAGRFLSTPTVAYASLAQSESEFGSDAELLRIWCEKSKKHIEVVTEEAPPTDSKRPQWQEILEGIKRGEIITLILPRLFHIAAEDMVEIAKFLTLLKRHNVTLLSLAEVIDSRRVSGSDIVIRAIPDKRKTQIVRGA